MQLTVLHNKIEAADINHRYFVVSCNIVIAITGNKDNAPPVLYELFSLKLRGF